MIRKPAVMGTFYPEDEKELNNMIEGFLPAGNMKEKAKGIVVPHAGYIYSGKVAGMTYGKVEIPDRIILIGPNHTGMGPAVSIMDKGIWEVADKEVPIDEELAAKILKISKYAKADIDAHLMEHSLEVQLPFLLYLNPGIKFVPVIIGTHDMEIIEDVGEAVAHVVEKCPDTVLIVASSDMSHYVSQEDAQYFDRMAIDRMELLDYKGLMGVIERENITMCGAAPAAVMLKACKILEAKKGKLVHYNTSAEVTGDKTQVVGYAGIKVV